MCKIFDDIFRKKPEIEPLSVPSRQSVIEEVSFAKPISPLMDSAYYYTNIKGWADIFDYIYFKFPMPKYIADRMDCDDFAFLLKSLVASFFGINYIAVTFGPSHLGYHAWNIIRTENGFYQFEPQTGEILDIYDRAYIPELLFL